MDVFLGKPLLNQKLKVILANEVLCKAKIIGLIFTANWCKSIKDLIPKLHEVFEEGKRRDYGLELVNVPLDKSLGDMLECFQTQGNWYSIIYGDNLAEELVWTYNITHIPAVVVLEKDGTVISKSGFKEVLDIGINVLVTWTYTKQIKMKPFVVSE